MARVTVEDCVDKVENRFDLVLLASHRARMVSAGQEITIERDNDKNPVVALREIAEQTVTPEDLREELIHTLQKYTEVDEPEPQPTPIEADTPEGRKSYRFNALYEGLPAAESRNVPALARMSRVQATSAEYPFAHTKVITSD